MDVLNGQLLQLIENIQKPGFDKIKIPICPCPLL
jgi:hypothetical protein